MKAHDLIALQFAQVHVRVKNENREKCCLRCNSVVKQIGCLTTKQIAIIDKIDMLSALWFSTFSMSGRINGVKL